jgi:ribosomal protein RSM22 (predicted rRNA methylase)
VLAPPHASKAAIEAKLCTANGVVGARIARRDKTAFASARRWRWGDAVEP